MNNLTIKKNTVDLALLREKIDTLRKERNAVILAHYYQEPAIQDIADFVGDSLELARWAATTNADVIVFAGVLFMAETAKILNPTKTVLLPDMKAGCSLSDSCPPTEFRAFLDAHPNHIVISYINCSIEIKAMSDIICTSSNAEQIINSIPKDQPIIFAPDKNLGSYLAGKTGRDLLLWDGACMVHEAFSIDKLLDLHKEFPNAAIIAHPESEAHVLKTASFIGSTAAMIRYVKESPNDQFIVATEAGILHRMKQDVPEKTLIPAPSVEDNTCACSECGYMKLNTMEKLYLCLKNNRPEIIIEEELRLKALKPLQECLRHIPKK
ncbi:MAG: quinolinate synthase NadA [Flavobacteriales bacterium]|nr:quinolinate synthase NadA [Flavobacteriales bacterium]